MKQKKKELRKQPDKIQAIKPEINLVYNKYYPVKFETGINYVLSGMAVLTGLFILFMAKSQNGFFCFPLDDSWIHLTFARNIVEYGSFSYYKNQLATSGSTSPLYTFILAGFYFFSKNEFIISYIIGISSFALAVFFMFRLAKLHFASAKWLAVLCALLLAIQPILNLIAVSGMETTMFIALVVISLYNYKRKNWTVLGISLGLLLWCRPDGLVLWVAIALDYLIKIMMENSKKSKKEARISARELITPFSIAAGIAVCYFLFNYFLSGSLLPNTYGAKLAIYEGKSRAEFLKNDVLGYFSAPEFVMYIIPFLLSLIIILNGLFTKRYNEFTVYFIFQVGLIFIYWYFIPFSSSFGRYLMPIIPCYIILAVYGVRVVSEYISTKFRSATPGNFLLVGYFAASVILIIINWNNISDLYTYSCKYYNDRHVAAGKWINKNTPPDAIVATHDIGAIEFYGKRKLVDMVGLVSPEIIDKMKAGFIGYLNNYLIEKKTDYVVTLKNWFEIVNDNPVFVPIKEPEFLEIYKFKPHKTHILDGQASGLIKQAIQFLNTRDNANAERAFLQALSVDPISSKTNFILAYFYISAGQTAKGEEYLNKALSIFPEYADANFMMAQMQLTKKNYVSAEEYNDKCLSIYPTNKDALDMKETLKNKLDNPVADK
jgi:tetratricopeptide (TPR) repeat protein